MLQKTVSDTWGYLRFVSELNNVYSAERNRVGDKAQIFFCIVCALYLEGVSVLTEDGKHRALTALFERIPRKGGRYGDRDFDRYMRELQKKQWIAVIQGELVVPANIRKLERHYLISVNVREWDEEE